MIELELDGKMISAEAGSTILEIALKDGKYIPHFCYHKKLSIAANCRMCLVEVEKSPKPLPACATPITEGMKIHTCSKLAVEAQKGVMEFLLINHPLDCPICDQGGECQLQDLAVGYGRSAARFEEEKRAVSNKDLGSLVSTNMTRCIHCSRCVRFTDEVAGYQELGMSYRNNHVEIMPFIGKTVDSEVSGNIIDICPVGALTSKPFRNQARSWELSRRKSVSPHDGLGSNLIVQVDKYHKVVRVLPFENESINECWISDRDRFSYEGLYHSDRITKPMIKQDGQWINVDWDVAIQYAAKSIHGVKLDHGSDAIGVMAHASSTVEELHLLQKLMRNIGVNNLDHRLSQTDFRLDKINGVDGKAVDGEAVYGGGIGLNTSYLGGRLTDLVNSKAVLLVGSNIRSEQPLVAVKLRNSVKHGMELHAINVIKEELLCDVKTQVVLDPREIEGFLLQILKALQIDSLTYSDILQHKLDLSKIVVTANAEQIANSLKINNGYVLLGEVAKTLPNYAAIEVIAALIAKLISGKHGMLSRFANEVGANLVGFVPYIDSHSSSYLEHNCGMNAQEMLLNPRRCYVLLNTELERDVYDSTCALAALNKADTVVVMSAYINENMREYADVILPITPFTETAGSFINMEGILQKFNPVTRPLDDAKPGWKILRVLANNLDVAGFEYATIEDVRSELVNLYNNSENGLVNNSDIDLDNQEQTAQLCNIINTEQVDTTGSVRVSLRGIYDGDSIVRRSKPLQETNLAKAPAFILSSVIN